MTDKPEKIVSEFFSEQFFLSTQEAEQNYYEATSFDVEQNRLFTMSEYQEKIVSGRLELVQGWKGYILKFEEQEITGASWSEFVNLSKEILKHELEENDSSVEDIWTPEDEDQFRSDPLM